MAIEFNYSRAIRQAAEIDAVADDIDRLVKNNLHNTQAALSNAWTGEAATLYLQNLQQFGNDAAAESRKLRRIASKIRKTAKIIAEAEQEAKRAAQQARSKT